MSVLSDEKRLHVLAALVDGNSERAVERMTDVSRLTIRRFALRLGKAAQSLHNTNASAKVVCCENHVAERLRDVYASARAGPYSEVSPGTDG